MGADQARPCEASCQIFLNLPRLEQLARKLQGTSYLSFELATRNQVCAHCTSEDSSADYCGQRLEMSCPLSRHLPQVLEVLQKHLPVST